MKLKFVLISVLACFIAAPGLLPGQGAAVAAQETVQKKNEIKYNPLVGEYGGQRTFSTYLSPKTFNIYLTTETPLLNILDYMYDGLFATNPLTQEVVPQLADSWEISEDKMTYTITLKNDLKWSDGHALTADDVVFTFNEILSNPDIPNIYKDALLIDNQLPVIEKIDNHHIKFYTNVPFVPFIKKLNFPILPKHMLEEAGKKNNKGEILFNNWASLESDPSSIVCNGPFRLEDYKEDKLIVLGNNPNYWKKDASGLQLPYLDRVNVQIIPDPVDEYNQFIAKEIDSLWITAKLGKILQPKAKSLDFNIQILEQTTGSLFIMFNLSTAKDKDGKQIVNPVKSAWFRNRKFRKALSYAIDKKDLIKKVYNSFAMPQYSSFSQNNSFYDPDAPKIKFDLKKSQALLREAGFILNKKEGLIDSKGNKVEFNLMTNTGNTVRDKTSQYISESWKKIGIKVNYLPEKYEDMMTRIDEKVDWDSALIGITGSNSDPNDNISIWKLDGMNHMFNNGNSGRNPYWMGRETSYEKWETDLQNLFIKAAGEFDPAKRKELYFKAQELEAEYLPFIYTAQPVPLVAVRNNIGNIFPTINAGNGLNAINWNIEEQFIIKK